MESLVIIMLFNQLNCLIDSHSSRVGEYIIVNTYIPCITLVLQKVVTNPLINSASTEFTYRCFFPVLSESGIADYTKHGISAFEVSILYLPSQLSPRLTTIVDFEHRVGHTGMLDNILFQCLATLICQPLVMFHTTFYRSQANDLYHSYLRHSVCQHCINSLYNSVKALRILSV